MVEFILHSSYTFLIAFTSYIILVSLFDKGKFEAIREGFYTALFMGILKEIFVLVAYQPSFLESIKDMSFNIVGLFAFIVISIVILERS